MVLDPSGSFGFVVKFFGWGSILLSLFVPRTGVYLLALQAAYLDILKRMAFVYGSGGNWIVVEILAIPLLTLAALIVGAFWKGLTSPKGISIVTIKLFVLCTILCLVSFAVSYFRQGALLESLRNTGYGVFYSFLAPVVSILYKDREDALKDMRWLCLLFLPVALYGIKQAFFGFSQFEWAYAEGGFSISGNQMFGDVPRPYSTLSSVEGYGCMAFFWVFATWHLLNYNKWRYCFLILALIFGTACITSLGRTPMLCVPIALAVYFFIRKPSTVALMYGGALSGFLFLVFFSDTVIKFTTWTGNFTSQLEGKSQRLATLSTTYERIYGLGELDNPKRWSWFGKPTDQFEQFLSHDHFTHILLRTGAVGLLTTLGVIALLTFRFHRRYWDIRDREMRAIIGVSVAFWIPFTAIGFMGGLGLDTSPYNYLFWFFIGIILFLFQRDRALWKEDLTDNAEKSPLNLEGGTLSAGGNTGAVANQLNH